MGGGALLPAERLHPRETPLQRRLDFLHESFFVPLAPKFRVNGSQSLPELGA
jgi:hypothetical protein